MSDAEIKSRFHILHLEVAHGSDRFEIHLHMQRPPLVRDLMAEVEKKTRVTLANQQLLFRGQRLHQTPEKELEKFGLFNGNRILLVGDTLTGTEDEHFRRILEIEKDVKIVDDVLELVCQDFENLKQRGESRARCERSLDDLKSRCERCRTDLQTFQSLVTQLRVDSYEPDASRKKSEVSGLIRDRLDISSNIMSAIAAY